MKEFQEDININTGRILRNLERNMTQYDRVVLLKCQNLTLELSQALAPCTPNKKVLILTTEQLAVKADNLTFRQITKEEANFLSGLYLTYEFSDKFILLSGEETSYPSLQCFMDTGLLSREELLELLWS